MSRIKESASVGAELTTMLAGPCPGIEVTAEHSGRWDRMCVTFRWDGFEGLLPEERYERLPTARFDLPVRVARRRGLFR